MSHQIVILLLYLPLVFGLNDVAIKFAIDYFLHRDVKFICVLSQERDRYWDHKLSSTAINNFIMISKVVLSDTIEEEKMRKCFRHNFSSIGVLIDKENQFIKDAAIIASRNQWFDSRHTWLIIDDNNERPDSAGLRFYGHTTAINFNVSMKLNGNDNTSESHLIHHEVESAKFENFFENLNLSVDADVMLSKSRGSRNFELYEIYNFGKVQGGRLVITGCAAWDLNSGLSSKLNEYKYYRRWDFQQFPMRMAVVTSSSSVNPNTFREVTPTAGIAGITKTAGMILDELANIHNIKFKYSPMVTWIGNLSRNSQTVISSIHFEVQDISPIIRLLKSVVDNVDFAHPPLTFIETRYYYRIPSTGPGKLENQFLQPLAPETWYYVLLIVGLCVLVLMLAALLEQRPSSVQYAFFSVFATFCQQSRKLATFITGLSCVLIYNYYTSSVVSWLLSGPPPSINSLQELLDSPLELIFEDIGYTRSWLQLPTYYYNKRNADVEDKLKNKVYKKKKDQPLFELPETGIEMVKAGGYAYHTEVSSANRLISAKFTQEELCELGSLKSMERAYLYPVLQKNSPYKEFFIWSLTRLSERGIVSCIQHRTTTLAVECEGSSPRALALGGAAPAFLLLAAGFFLSTVILLMERLTAKYVNRKNGYLRQFTFGKPFQGMAIGK